MHQSIERWFGSQNNFHQHLALIAACLSGLAGIKWWVGILLPAITLTLLSWHGGWQHAAGRASLLDRERREIGSLAYALGRYGLAAKHYFRSYRLWQVHALKMRHDGGICAGCFAAGYVCRWLLLLTA
jgi:hypothetical protein